MQVPEMSPPPYFGAGYVEKRYEPIERPKPLPWYFDQTKTTFAAVMAILVWVVIANAWL